MVARRYLLGAWLSEGGIQWRWSVALALLAIPVLCGFDSFNRPIEQVAKDPVLRAEIELKLRAGQRNALYANHYWITKRCLQRAGVRPDVVEVMSLTVCDIDFDNWHNSSHYEAKNHCDRAGKSHVEAFEQALRYHRERVAEAWHSFSFGDLNNVKKILPRALHDQEDFFSHSNYVDLCPDAQKELMTCWTRYGASGAGGHDQNYAAIEKDGRCIGQGLAWNGKSGSLLITGYDPNASNPYFPLNDPYPHLNYAKDNAVYNTEAQLPARGWATKYQAAEQAALDACVASVNDFRRLCLLDEGCKEHVGKMFLTNPWCYWPGCSAESALVYP